MKKDKTNKQDKEATVDPVLQFEAAKEMTVAEAVRKHEELKAGVTETDGVLDRYIKQHREDIESDKFETQSLKVEDTVAVAVEDLGIHKVEDHAKPVAASFVSDEMPEFPAPETAEFNDYEDVDRERAALRKKIVLWSVGTILAVILLGTVYLLTDSSHSAKIDSSTSSSSTTAKTTTTSSSKDSQLTAFDELYATFFTDSDLKQLKNSAFDNLPSLKTELDKLDASSDAYKDAKTRYDNLEKAIQAVQSLNKQFNKPVIVDGQLDTTATVKSGETLEATTTGLDTVDSLIASAVNFGRSQQTTTASSSAPTDATTDTRNTGEETASANVAGAGASTSAGVTLQRSLSRVPYNQSAINDTNNSAWTFGDGVLENILSISRQRGYITGDQYILEKVNIINGNGYYNLFKPDGTYLFSINAQTGYFVGNGSGYSDDLDY